SARVTATAANARLSPMKFLARLAAGDVALWRVFWLIGIPLALVWDISGLSMITGYGVGEPAVAVAIIALFTASCLALPFLAWAIWRSASRYPRQAWWHHALAWAATLSAVVSGLAAGLSLVAVLYLAYGFIYAVLIVG
ncbi:MAG TPA: hypothetical protein VHY10_17275, partial [Xanthobacteraceae bacterium]|nr:hypothetical protein [Xanthobacteraceae bacterium]